ncbi:hypothetical protein [Burkholderia ubonensis]|nr:hypothetical protein [Burkholderia ubonensis]
MTLRFTSADYNDINPSHVMNKITLFRHRAVAQRFPAQLRQSRGALQ